MSFPTTPSYIGQKWLDGGRVWQWNGTAWQAANNSVFWEEIAGKPTYIGNAIVTTSAPANPIPGLQWWNPTADRIFIWDGSAWVEPNTSSTYPWDADAADYIYRVEAADGQELEQATRKAINAFVIGCKTDAIWTALKASCIMAGARTLAGALTPLVGAAPTNVNFMSTDYVRKTGLKGDGLTKYLNSNRNSNSDPLNNFHHSVYVYEYDSSTTFQALCGVGSSSTSGATHLYDNAGANSRNRTTTGISMGSVGNGFWGSSRTASNQVTARKGGINYNSTAASQSTEITYPHHIYSRNQNPSAGLISPSRLSFYSIGESLNLALLDARVSTLMSDLQTSIP